MRPESRDPVTISYDSPYGHQQHVTDDSQLSSVLQMSMDEHKLGQQRLHRAVSPPAMNKFINSLPPRANSTPPGQNDAELYGAGQYNNNNNIDPADAMVHQLSNMALNDVCFIYKYLYFESCICTCMHAHARTCICVYTGKKEILII